MRKSLRLMMHALAVFMLLVAVATGVFWVRSRTRLDYVIVRWNSVHCEMISWNSMARLSWRGAPAGPLPLTWEVGSNPRIPAATYAWSYTAIGRDPTDPDHWFHFLGVQVGRYPALKEEWVYIPDSYLLLLGLSVPAWWFWRVRRGANQRQSGFPVQPL